jgi:hypothetical protein
MRVGGNFLDLKRIFGLKMSGDTMDDIAKVTALSRDDR